MSANISTPWLLVWFLTALSFCWLWTKSKRHYTKYKIPPFPVKPWPIVGHFFLMFGDFREKMKQWRSKTGNIYSLDIVGKLHILVKDIKEIWIKHADSIPNLQHNFGDDILGEDNKGIIGARDDNWKEQRATSLSILRSLGMGRNIMAERIQEEVSVFLTKLEILKGQPENIQKLLNVSVSNVICSVAVGRRFEHEDNYFIRLVGSVNTMMKYFNTMLLLTPFKQLYWLPGDLFHAKKWFKASVEITEEFSRPYTLKLKNEFNENKQPDNFVTAYFNEMKKMRHKGVNSNLDDANLIVIIRTLFIAGTETVSTAILWCLLYMLHTILRYRRKYIRKLRRMSELTVFRTWLINPNLLI